MLVYRTILDNHLKMFPNNVYKMCNAIVDATIIAHKEVRSARAKGIAISSV